VNYSRIVTPVKNAVQNYKILSKIKSLSSTSLHFNTLIQKKYSRINISLTSKPGVISQTALYSDISVTHQNWCANVKILF